MKLTRVSVRPNGPIMITGPVQLVDPAGITHEIPEGRIIALCRCGQSGSKPYCDGRHNACGFKSSDPAPVR